MMAHQRDGEHFGRVVANGAHDGLWADAVARSVTFSELPDFGLIQAKGGQNLIANRDTGGITLTAREIEARVSRPMTSSPLKRLA